MLPTLLLAGILAVLHPVFAHIGVEEGLSQTTVLSIAQDVDGQMWFGTYDGLNRFDGYEMQVYMHGEDSTSLAGNNVSRVFLDSGGRIWVASDGGIDLYDRSTDVFRHVFPARAFVVTDMMELEGRGILVGSNQGTFLVEPAPDGGFRAVRSRIGQRRHAVFELLGDRLVVGGVSSGIRVVDLRDSSETNLPALDACREVGDITRVGSRIWISTNGGGLYSERVSLDGDVQHFLHGTGNSLCSDYVRAVCPDDEGRLWIATADDVSVLDTLTGAFTTLSPLHYVSGGPSQCSVKSVLRSSDGGIWLGSYHGGVSYYHPERNFFRRIELSSPPIICGGMSLCEDGSLWIGSFRQGLFHYRPASGEIRHVGLSQGPVEEDIKAVRLSADGRRLFVSAAQGGLYVCSAADGRTLGHYGGTRAVYDSFEDENGVLWICSMSGVFCLDPVRGSFRKVEFSERESLPAFRILRSSDGWYWIGAVGGLIRCHLSVDGNGVPEYSDWTAYDTLSFVLDIFESSSGTVWVATRAGFYAIDADRITKVELPAPTNMYCGIEEDAGGRLWVSTENGLVCYTPQTGAARLFTVKDGLPSNCFCGFAHALAPDGTLYVGGNSGVSSLDSRGIGSERSAMTPEISGIWIAGGGVPRVRRDGTYVLKHSQNSFDVHFNVIDYISWQQGSFRYILDGYDNEWRQVRGREAAYSNVKSGRYRFLVAYRPAGATEFSDQLEVPVIVRPVWYLSTLALLFWALVAAAAILLLVYSAIDRERNRNRKEIERLSEISARTERENLCLKYAHTPHLSDSDYDFLKRARDAVMENLSNEDFAVEALSDTLGLTRTSVYVRLKKITGDTALNFIRNIRLREACRLLEEGGQSMSEIAESVGFRTAAYFSTCFKSQLGMTPRQYLLSKKA